MERRVRPIRYLFHTTVLDRVVMDVIHVPLKIQLVGDRVFLISPLPQRMLALRIVCHRHPGFHDGVGECAFDCVPPPGIIIVARWQRPDGVQVFGKNYDGIDAERVFAPNLAESCAQQFNVFRQDTG